MKTPNQLLEDYNALKSSYTVTSREKQACIDRHKKNLALFNAEIRKQESEMKVLKDKLLRLGVL